VADIFKRHGFRWGGDYPNRHDWMHFEYLGEPVKEVQEDMAIDTVSAATVQPYLAKLQAAGIIDKPTAHAITDAASVGLLWVVIGRLLDKIEAKSA
jgi:hypothetical protein